MTPSSSIAHTALISSSDVTPPEAISGIRVANGHPMTYDVLFPGSERGAGDRAFQIIQGDFLQIGVKLVQKPVQGAYGIMTAPDNKYLNWDLAMWDWTPPLDPDFILSAMTCHSFGNWSDSGYCNKAYDALYAKQTHTVDEQARLAVVNHQCEIEREIRDVRKGMRGIDGERRQDREDLLIEDPCQTRARRGIQIFPLLKDDARLGEFG